MLIYFKNTKISILNIFSCFNIYIIFLLTICFLTQSVCLSLVNFLSTVNRSNLCDVFLTSIYFITNIF